MTAELAQHGIDDEAAAPGTDELADELVADVIVEEVSIDGMCGVY
jgi:mycofactocin precursor